MNYTFKIIDTKQNNLTTTVEKAEGGSVIVEWLGGDKKDDLLIVGSRVSFTMVGMSQADGQYLDLFTGDETRFKVVQEDENGNIIMNWHVLPDSYEEPYTNSPILVNFTATDGLGRLKGKYLREDFYKEEKSVIEILAACLRLTGLSLHLRFAPAYENYKVRDYNLIYLDTALFKNNDKKEDAYKILNDLLESLCCTLYQADNYYNIEGFNIRNLRTYEAKVYASDGTLIDNVEVTRNKKYITGLATPVVNAQAPYGVVNISHKQEPLQLPEELHTEVNDGWSANGKTQRIIENLGLPGEQEQETELDVPQIFATEWWGNGGFYAYAGPDENAKVYFGFAGDSLNRYINLRRQPYVEKGRKYELKLDFELITPNLTSADTDTFISEGRWTNPFDVFITMDSEEIPYDPFGFNTLLYTNTVTGKKGFTIAFDEDKKSPNTIQITAPYSGLLNIEIRGIKDWNGVYNRRYIKSVQINECSISDLGFKEEVRIEKTLTADYTSKKELDLRFGDDPYGLSSAFRFKKLKEPFDSDTIAVSTGRKFPFQGAYYAIVSLGGANLIAENLDTSPELQNIVEEVIYNYNQSDAHVVKLKDQFNGNNFTVVLRNYNAVTEVRDYWKQWTDTFYKVEKKRIPEIVANIHNRLFDKPVFRVLDYNLKNNIKFNDFIDWKFSDKKDWILTNCIWDVHNGITTVSIAENYYAITPGANIPPVVEAGEDQEFNGRDGELTCEAFDPDGYIVSYEWKLVSGTGVTIIEPNAQNTSFRILGGAAPQSYYEFEVTVTDNDGATASDRVIFYKTQDLVFELEEVYSDSVVGQGVLNPYIEKHFKAKFTPELPVDTSVNIQGLIFAEWWAINNGQNDAHVIIEQDGYESYKVDASVLTYNPDLNYRQEDDFSIDYIRGSELIFKLRTAKADQDYYQGEAKAHVTVSGIEYSNGKGTITGVPTSEEIYLEIDL